MTEHTYLDEEQAADLLHRKKSTLQVWRSTGRGPTFIKDGEGKVLYRKADLISFIEGTDGKR